MTDCNGGTGDPRGTSAGAAIARDAKTLEDTMREAIRTSPDSFLATLVDVASKRANDWIHEIKSSTWVIAERDGKGVGVAACKPPDPSTDREDRTESRYIESVWIHPDLRGNQLGERLINYLMAAEHHKNQFVRRFLLWVFTTNSSAIKLYERLGFVQTAEQQEGIRTEIKYRLEVKSGTGARIFPTVHGAAFLADRQKYGVTYRVLGDEDPA
jgi:ribosomal protein S18 acetylase RimI-like enzyme